LNEHPVGEPASGRPARGMLAKDVERRFLQRRPRPRIRSAISSTVASGNSTPAAVAWVLIARCQS
jgi:hypothetical protein